MIVYIYYILSIKSNPINGVCKVVANKFLKDGDKFLSSKTVEKGIPNIIEAENRVYILERTTYRNLLKIK